MSADKRAREPFVGFGPEQAEKAREEAGLPEPQVVTDVPQDAGLIRRNLGFLVEWPGRSPQALVVSEIALAA